MKKYTNYLLLSLVFCVVLSAFTWENNVIIQGPPVTIPIGSGGPGGYSGDCSGSGFCGCTPIGLPFQPPQFKVINGITSVENDRFCLTIERKNLTEETYSKYFKSGIFIMENTFTLDNSLSKKLGFYSPYIIKAGKYKVKEKDNILFLVF